MAPTDKQTIEQLAARVEFLEDKIVDSLETVKETQARMCDDISKIKEAVYNPDTGLYARLRTLEDYVEIIERYEVIWPEWVSNYDDKKEAIHALVGLSRISEFSRDKYHIWYRANISVYWNEKKQILTTSETRDMYSNPVCACPRCGSAFYNKLDEYLAIPFTDNQINCNFCKPDERGRTKFNRSKPVPLEDIGLAGLSTASYI